jgi:hypothetical protein
MRKASPYYIEMMRHVDHGKNRGHFADTSNGLDDDPETL